MSTPSKAFFPISGTQSTNYPLDNSRMAVTIPENQGATHSGLPVFIVQAPRLKRTYDSYDLSFTRVCAVIQMVCGVFSIALGIASPLECGELGFVGYGIWSGVMYIIAGTIEWMSAEKRTTFLIVTTTVLCVINSCLGAIQFCLGVYSADNNSKRLSLTVKNCPRPVSTFPDKIDWNGAVVVDALLACTGLVEATTAIFASIACCIVICGPQDYATASDIPIRRNRLLPAQFVYTTNQPPTTFGNNVYFTDVKPKTMNRGMSVSRGNLMSIIKSISTVLIKVDGFLWVGQNRLEGASEIVHILEEKGKKVIFISNDDTMSKNDILYRLIQCGVENVVSEAVVSCGFATAYYLKKKLKISSLFCLGSKSLIKELKNQGIEVLTWNHDEVFEASLEEFLQDNKVKVVLLGMHLEFSFKTAVEISLYFRNHEDVLFIATNKQPTFLVCKGVALPGTGCLLGMMTEMGCKSPDHIIGMPEEPFLRILLHLHVIDPETTLLIGDRLDSDMLFAYRSGFKSLLTLTGVTDIEEAHTKEFSDDPSDRVSAPDFIVDSAQELYEMIKLSKESGDNNSFAI